MATAEDSPVAMKLKKMWLKTPVGEEQAAQAVLDPAIGMYTSEMNKRKNAWERKRIKNKYILKCLVEK